MLKQRLEAKTSTVYTSRNKKPEAKAKAKQEAEQLQMLKIDNKTTTQGIQ